MWLPESADEIERLAGEGSLEETHHFDAKAVPGVGRDVAVDVCAMTVDGGTLLYGVGEDENGRPTRPAPIELEGQRERIDQIAATSIFEPPTIVVTERPLADDPTRGYLVVNVPQSSRAPHQVVVRNDLRYYGRGATGNRVLTEPEIAQFYARRERWEIDRDRLLDKIIADAPFEHSQGAFLHAFAHPVAPDPAMLRRALGDDEMVLRNALVAATNSVHVRGGGGIAALRELSGWELHGAEGITIGDASFDEYRFALQMTIGHDGSTTLFGCAGFTYDNAKLLLVDSTAANLGNFLASAGALYEIGEYLGNVDVGVALSGTEGGIPRGQERGFHVRGYPHDSYRETDRALAHELRERPHAVASGSFGASSTRRSHSTTPPGCRRSLISGAAAALHRRDERRLLRDRQKARRAPPAAS